MIWFQKKKMHLWRGEEQTAERKESANTPTEEKSENRKKGSN